MKAEKTKPTKPDKAIGGLSQKTGQGQEEFFKKVISSLPHPFYVIDAEDYSLVLANDAALKGRDIKSLFCYSLAHKRNTPCDGSDHGCTLAIVKKTKKPVELEHVHYDIDGQPRNVRVSGYPIFDNRGKVVQMVEYCIDITEKKKNSRDLEKTEAMFRSLVDNIKGCMAIYEAVEGGEDFVIIEFNRSAEKIEKIKKEDVLGRKVTQAFPGVKDLGLLQILKKVYMTGKPENMPAAFYDDGRVSGWRTNYVYKLESGQVVALYYDVTKEKEKEQKISENNIFLKSIISSLSHPFYVINVKDYSLLMANEAALQGRPLAGLTCYNISHKTNKPCDSQEHGCTLEIVKRTKQPVVLEHIHYDRDGQPKYVDVHGYPVFNEKGELVQMIEYCIDISVRKKMEMDLEAKNILNESILGNAPFGIYVVNDQGGIDYVNESMLQISGTPREHFLGLNMFEHKFYKAIGLSDRIKEALKGKKFYMEMVKYTSAFSGKTTVRNFSGFSINENSDKKVLMFVEDITGISRAQEEVQKRNAELEKFNEIAVDRELKMVELKKKIKELEGKFK